MSELSGDTGERSSCYHTLPLLRVVRCCFDNSALVGYLANSLLPNPKAGLRRVGEMIGDGKDYEIVLEWDVPAWVLDHVVKPLVELARRSDGGIGLTIRQKNGPLA